MMYIACYIVYFFWSFCSSSFGSGAGVGSLKVSGLSMRPVVRLLQKGGIPSPTDSHGVEVSKLRKATSIMFHEEHCTLRQLKRLHHNPLLLRIISHLSIPRQRKILPQRMLPLSPSSNTIEHTP